MAELLEKKKSQTTYQIELTEDELQIILAVYGNAHYDYYIEKSYKYGYQVASREKYFNLYNNLIDDILESN